MGWDSSSPSGEGGDATVHRLYLHHHSRFASEGIVVHLAVLVQRVVAQVMHRQSGQSLVLGPFQNGTIERPVQHFGHYSDDVNPHILKFDAKVRKKLRFFTYLCQNNKSVRPCAASYLQTIL